MDKLKEPVGHPSTWQPEVEALRRRVAELEPLRHRVAELEAALEPFANVTIDGDHPAKEHIQETYPELASNLLRARAAMGEEIER